MWGGDQRIERHRRHVNVIRDEIAGEESRRAPNGGRLDLEDRLGHDLGTAVAMPGRRARQARQDIELGSTAPAG